MQNKPLTAPLGEALAKAAAAEDPKAAPVSIGDAIKTIDTEDRRDSLPIGSGDFDALFTAVRFSLVSGDVYARERERRNKPSLVTGYSRKVADCQIELSGTGLYTPGTISVVQGIAEKSGHLEMSVGVFNPETRKSSFTCADAATKDRFQAWKDRTCRTFKSECDTNGIDLTAPSAGKEHANAVNVNLLAHAPQPQA